MDNLQVHKTKRVRELIEGRGCSLVFLPRYSPDFNRIKEAFSKVEDAAEEGESQELRSAGGGHRRCALRGQRAGCSGFLRPLRIRHPSGAFIMKTALSAREIAEKLDCNERTALK